jgi:hypothetical protein
MTTVPWLLAGLLLAANALPPDVAPVNDHKVRIGIQLHLKPEQQPLIKDVLLFVSTDGGKHWQQQDRVPPGTEAFLFNAPADGDYWFAVAVVDRQGKQTPEDLLALPPERIQKVLVDTLRPDVRVVSADRVGDEVVVKFEALDVNLDPASVMLEYRTADMPAGTWTPVAVSPAGGQASFRPVGTGAVEVRLTAKDVAGNIGTATGTVAAASAAPTVAAGTVPPAPAPVPPTPTPPLPLPVPPAPTPDAAVTPVSRTTGPPSRLEQSPPLWNRPNPAVTVLANPAQAGQQIASSGKAPPAAPTAPSFPGPTGPADPAAPAAPLPQIQVVRDPQITLRYTVKDVGPSGLGAVELYVTRDDGRTWQLAPTPPSVVPSLTTDAAGAPGPQNLTLTVGLNSGEGVYGFTIAVRSKAGLGTPPPQPGTPPRLRVELDTTPPEANLYMAPGHRNTLVLTWEVRDRNLAPNPVTLDWAERKDGPWNTIAHDLPKDPAQYEWHLPTEVKMPPRVYLRLTARDVAGNVCEALTPDAILNDLSETTVENIQLGTGHP